MEQQTQLSVSSCHVKNLSCQVEKLFNLFIFSPAFSLFPPWIQMVHEILYTYCIKQGTVFYVSYKLGYGM
jgi:hypothetical protein